VRVDLAPEPDRTRADVRTEIRTAGRVFGPRSVQRAAIDRRASRPRSIGRPAPASSPRPPGARGTGALRAPERPRAAVASGRTDSVCSAWLRRPWRPRWPRSAWSTPAAGGAERDPLYRHNAQTSDGNDGNDGNAGQSRFGPTMGTRWEPPAKRWEPSRLGLGQLGGPPRSGSAARAAGSRGLGQLGRGARPARPGHFRPLARVQSSAIPARLAPGYPWPFSGYSLALSSTIHYSVRPTIRPDLSQIVDRTNHDHLLSGARLGSERGA
jgi:hypothetical protein